MPELIHRHRLIGLRAGQTDEEFWGDIMQLAVCPNCGAEHPDFHSLVGSIETLCNDCGWSSEEANPHFRSSPELGVREDTEE